MNATAPLSADAQKKADAKRKRRALLAGGVVLGLGAAVTLAAWTDDVFADGVFNTGDRFELVGAVDSGVVADAALTFQTYNGPDSADGQTGHMDFSVDASNMAPGQTVYAPLTLATGELSSMAGTVTLAGVEATGTYAPLLTYRIYRSDAVDGHGVNCSEAGVENLTEWTNPTDGLTAFIAGITDQVPLINTLLTPVQALIPQINRPVIDPLPLLQGAPLPVGANNEATPYQHLCVAVEMGLPSSSADTLGLVDGVNGQLVNALTTNGDNATTVTWQFTGTANTTP